MESTFFIVGVLVGMVLLATIIKAERIYDRRRTAAAKRRLAEYEAFLIQMGWRPPLSGSVNSSPFPEWDWSGDVPDSARNVRIGFTS